MQVTSYTPGDFCWPELATTDPEGAKRFYGALFGWTATDNDMGGGASYTMLYKDGKDAAALYALREEMRAAGLSPFWMSYVSVKSADESTRRAKELGATIAMPPADVGEHGRMAVISDPTGASFGLWQPRKQIGARVMGENGSFCWNELYTRDAARAKAFYTALFGWRPDAVTLPAPPYDYTAYMLGEIRVAGMMEIPSDWGPVPPHWLVYFAVDDCNAAEAKARGLGAQSVYPPSDLPGVGRLAILKDPQGAAFALFRAGK
jgi:predicted enzyme related to lactoylglutathione lyase